MEPMGRIEQLIVRLRGMLPMLTTLAVKYRPYIRIAFGVGLVVAAIWAPFWANHEFDLGVSLSHKVGDGPWYEGPFFITSVLALLGSIVVCIFQIIAASEEF